MRILIAEDEHDLNDLIAQRLTKEHYSVDSCYDGEEAIDYIRMADYDAIILELMKKLNENSDSMFQRHTNFE